MEWCFGLFYFDEQYAAIVIVASMFVFGFGSRYKYLWQFDVWYNLPAGGQQTKWVGRDVVAVSSPVVEGWFLFSAEVPGFRQDVLV